MTIADANEMVTQREKIRSRNLPKQGTHFSGGDKITEKVVGGYKAVEDAVTGGYKKIEDKFVDKFLRHEGETVEEAKARINREQEACREKQEAEAKERAEKIAKISGAKVTTKIQAGIKAKHNL